MDHRHSFVLGAIVAVAGVAIGALTVSAAVSSIAFSGVNPNNGQPGVRTVGVEGAREQRNAIVRDRKPSGASRLRRDIGNAYRRAHGSADERSTENVDVQDSSLERCEGTSGPRGARCKAEAQQGRTYRLRQTDLPTE